MLQNSLFKLVKFNAEQNIKRNRQMLARVEQDLQNFTK
jgi:hypothetical protein